MAMPKKLHTLDSIKAKCVEGEGDCWFWDGYFQNNTPQVFHNGIMFAVRKLVLVLEGTPIPPKVVYFAPKCDNPACVNPGHVITRTARQHAFAMSQKVDHQSPIRIVKLQEAAQARGIVVLGRPEVDAIIADPRSGPVIAKDYGVTRSLISKIKTGKARRVVSAVDNPWAGLMR